MQTGAGCFLDLEGRSLQTGAGFLLKLATAPRRSTTAQTRSRYSQRNFAGWPTPHTRWAMRRVLFLQRGANRSLEFEGWVCFLLKLAPPPPRRSICDTCSRSPCGTVARLSGVSSMTPGLVTSESWHPGAIPIYDTIRIPTRRPHGPETRGNIYACVHVATKDRTMPPIAWRKGNGANRGLIVHYSS